MLKHCFNIARVTCASEVNGAHESADDDVKPRRNLSLTNKQWHSSISFSGVTCFCCCFEQDYDVSTMPRFRWAWFWEWSERNFVDSRWYAMHIHVTICKCARLSSVVCFQAKGCFQKFFQRGAKPSTPKNDNNFSARWRNNGPGVGVPTAQTKICALFRRFGPNVRVFIASADGVFCILRPVSYLNERYGSTNLEGSAQMQAKNFRVLCF